MTRGQRLDILQPYSDLGFAEVRSVDDMLTFIRSTSTRRKPMIIEIFKPKIGGIVMAGYFDNQEVIDTFSKLTNVSAVKFIAYFDVSGRNILKDSR